MKSILSNNTRCYLKELNLLIVIVNHIHFDLSMSLFSIAMMQKLQRNPI